MPADNVHGLRADTLELLRRLNAPIYRWPGGNFVSGYNWKDGIGDRDRRPARWERAWNDVEDNDFGIDEFLDFCREINTEPLIVVNTGLGGFDQAAQEVEYANGPAESRWGGERAHNGHPAPYGVAWWGIGNEMYGNWQLGNVPVERYVLRHNAFVAAMRAVDSRIRVVAVGAGGKWNDLIVPGCAAHADLLSLHHYSERKLRVPLSARRPGRYARLRGLQRLHRRSGPRPGCRPPQSPTARDAAVMSCALPSTNWASSANGTRLPTPSGSAPSNITTPSATR